MRESILNVVALRAALGRLELGEVARRTVGLAEHNMPSCAWLDAKGKVSFAETMSEVDGLVLCQAREIDEGDELDDCYWVGGWLREVGLSEVAERLEHELKQTLAGLPKRPWTLRRGSGFAGDRGGGVGKRGRSPGGGTPKTGVTSDL